MFRFTWNKRIASSNRPWRPCTFWPKSSLCTKHGSSTSMMHKQRASSPQNLLQKHCAQCCSFVWSQISSVQMHELQMYTVYTEKSTMHRRHVAQQWMANRGIRCIISPLGGALVTVFFFLHVAWEQPTNWKTTFKTKVSFFPFMASKTINEPSFAEDAILRSGRTFRSQEK